MPTTAVIPTLNEVDGLARVLAEFPPGWVDRVIVVDGGSTDGTPEVARRLGAEVLLEARRGYGRACAAGAAAAGPEDVLVFLDGDGSDDPADLPALVAPVQAGAVDLMLGSRLVRPLPPGVMPAHQQFGNRLAVALIRRLYRARLTDLGPFRCIRAEVLRGLAMREMTYGWPTEMIVKAARRGLRVAELPVHYRRRAAGQSKISGTLRGTVLAAYYILGVTARYALWK